MVPENTSWKLPYRLEYLAITLGTQRHKSSDRQVDLSPTSAGAQNVPSKAEISIAANRKHKPQAARKAVGIDSESGKSSKVLITQDSTYRRTAFVGSETAYMRDYFEHHRPTIGGPRLFFHGCSLLIVVFAFRKVRIYL